MGVVPAPMGHIAGLHARAPGACAGDSRGARPYHRPCLVPLARSGSTAVAPPFARARIGARPFVSGGEAVGAGSADRTCAITRAVTCRSSRSPNVSAAAASGKYQLQHGVWLERGPRGEMEDDATVETSAVKGFLYAGVFDGHGGYASASYLKKNLHQQIGKAAGKGGNLSEVVSSTFEAVDAALLKHLSGLDDEYEQASGATGTVCLASANKVLVANVGDSRAVLSKGGKAVDLSEEHRVFGNAPAVSREVKRVESVGGWVKDGRVCSTLAVSRAFGDYMFKGKGKRDLLLWGEEEEFWNNKFSANVTFTGDPVVATPDVTEVALTDDDEFVIVATDGLWDVLSSTAAVSFVREQLMLGIEPQEVAKRLVTRAIKRRTQDNTSAVVIDLGRPRDGWVKITAGGVSQGQGDAVAAALAVLALGALIPFLSQFDAITGALGFEPASRVEEPPPPEEEEEEPEEDLTPVWKKYLNPDYTDIVIAPAPASE